MHGAKGGAPVLTGMYSKYAPRRLAGKFEEFEGSPELVGSRRHLALLELFISERFEKLDAPDAAAILDAVRLQFQGFTEVVDLFENAIGPLADEETKNGLQALRAWHQAVRELLETDLERRRAEAEIRELVQEATVVQKQETRRLALIAKAMTDREFNAFVATVIATIERHVKDPDVRRRIGLELVRAVSSGAGPRVSAE